MIRLLRAIIYDVCVFFKNWNLLIYFFLHYIVYKIA